jgi:predicted anti-sigma-YlaC factor YlaD
MITCQQFAASLNNYLTHDVSPEAEVVFTDHLAQCEQCRIDLQRYRQVIQLAHALEDLPLPPSLHSRFSRLLSSKNHTPPFAKE